MSNAEIISHIDTVASRLDSAASRYERLGKILLACLTLIVTGAVWAARLEMKVSENSADISGMKPAVDDLKTAVATIKGHLGIAENHKSRSHSIDEVASKVMREEER